MAAHLDCEFQVARRDAPNAFRQLLDRASDRGTQQQASQSGGD